MGQGVRILAEVPADSDRGPRLRAAVLTRRPPQEKWGGEKGDRPWTCAFWSCARPLYPWGVGAPKQNLPMSSSPYPMGYLLGAYARPPSVPLATCVAPLGREGGGQMMAS